MLFGKSYRDEKGLIEHSHTQLYKEKGWNMKLSSKLYYLYYYTPVDSSFARF